MNDTNLNTKERTEAPVAEHTRGNAFFTPRVDILETDKELVVFADVPGVKPDEVELRYENGELLLHGKVAPRQHAGQLLLAEYGEGDFYRLFTIHESIDSSKVEATCKNGVLTIHLPKVEAVQPKQIKVKG